MPAFFLDVIKAKTTITHVNSGDIVAVAFFSSERGNWALHFQVLI